MSETLVVDGLQFTVRRSTRRKSIGITIGRDGALVAHVPIGVELERAGELVRSRTLWVHQKLARCEGRTGPDVFRKIEFVDGEGVHFLGTHYRLRIVDADADADDGSKFTTALQFSGDRLLCRREQVGVGGQRLQEYYTRAAHPYLNRAVRNWRAIVGVAPQRHVRVRELGFGWASCSDDGTLNFHWRIMQLPPHIIDYIVVHELTHLRVREHSAEFWAQVGRVLPRYEDDRRWLDAKGGQL